MGDYASPDGRKVGVISNMGVLFSDGFGGSAVDTVGRWDVIDGGLGANPTLHGVSLTQGAIGSGVTGMTDAVSGSVLSVTMGTTPNAERWYLSQGAFGGSEDITVILARPAVLTANSVWIGLVEVGPAGIPLLNPNLANEFTNRGGVEFMKQNSNQAGFIVEAIEDSAGTLATTGVVAVNAPAAAAYFETVMEFHAEDLIASTSTVDSSLGRSSAVARLSSQVPNDGRQYKLLMRFRNIGTPGSSSVIQIQRILVVDSQEFRVEIASGRGDQVPQKGVPVNIASPLPVTGSHKLFSAATTNATSVKTSQGYLLGGLLSNVNAAIRYFKLYNKASAPVVGTDTPIFTVAIPAGSSTVPGFVNLENLFGSQGHVFAAGIAYAITGAAPDSDTTAVAANDVIVNLNYL